MIVKPEAASITLKALVQASLHLGQGLPAADGKLQNIHKWISRRTQPISSNGSVTAVLPWADQR